MQRGFSVYGVKVRFRWEHPEVGRAVEDLAVHFALDPIPTSRVLQEDILLHVSVSEPPWQLPDDAEEIGALEDEARVWRANGSVYFGREAALMRIDPSGGVGVGYVRADAGPSSETLRSYCHGMYLNSLVLLLPKFRLFALHSAAVSLNDRGLLLPASGDSGKSTLAYSLVREGWNFVSDDSVLLTGAAAGVRALSFRRTFALDFEAEQHFPELQPLEKSTFAESRKRALSMTTLRPKQAASACAPDTIVFPQIEERSVSELAEIGKSEALRLLIMQSTITSSNRRTAEQHLETLRRLVTQARTYRLTAGRDLVEVPARAADLLGEVMAAP